MSGEIQLRWRAPSLTRALATCAAVGLASALFTMRGELVAFAAPLLGVLCSVGWQPRPPGVRVGASSPLQRCFETEPSTVQQIWAVADDGSDVTLTPSTVGGANLATMADGRCSARSCTATWGTIRVDVVSWPADATLDQAMALTRTRPARARR